MAERLRVVVAWSPAPRCVQEQSLELPTGCTVADAVAASRLHASWPEADRHELAFFVWGRAAQAGQALRDGDRVEVLRELRVDPKVARRERFQRQGARAAGLFARGKPPAQEETAPAPQPTGASRPGD